MTYRTRIEYEGRHFLFDHFSHDHIAKAQESKGTFYEVDLLRTLQKLLRGRPQTQWVLDGGAHIGNHSVFFNEVCGRRVTAYEPNPLIFRCLLENTGETVLALPVAISDGQSGMLKYAGVGQFELNTGMSKLVPPGEGSGPPIPSITLDSLVEGTSGDPCALIKLDIEGHEKIAIEHGLELIKRDRPILAIEDKRGVKNRSERRLAVLEWLERLPSYNHYGTYCATPTHVFVPVPVPTAA